MIDRFDIVQQNGRNSVDNQLVLAGAAVARGPNRPPFRNSMDIQERSIAAELWRIIRKRKWVVIGFVTVVVALVVTASLMIKPRFEAIGRIVVSFHRDNDGGVLGFKGVDTAMEEDPQEHAGLDTQISILQTDALARQVMNNLQMETNPSFNAGGARSDDDVLVKSFHDNLNVSKVKGTRVIEIKFRSKDPQLAANVVNGLAAEYVDEFYRSQFQVSKQLADFLNGQLEELRGKVEESQRKLVAYQKQNGLFGLEDRQNIVAVKLSDLNRDLTAAEGDRADKEIQYRLALSGRPDLIAKLDPDSLITKLRAQEADLQNQIAQASVQLGHAHPKMAELSQQLAQVRKSAADDVDRIRYRIAYDYKQAVGREDVMRKALEAQKRAADTLSASAVQAEILKHEFDTNRKLYDDLLQKQRELGISGSLKSNNVWIADPATAPKQPIEPNPKRNIALSLLSGIVGGVLLAFGMDKLDTTISTVEQAQVLSATPVLGVVPQVESHKAELVSVKDPMSVAAESYKTVLASLLLSQSSEPQVILVTSALAGEGKTSVSTNIAMLLARLHRRVLLVDADLRRPRIQNVMQFSARSGLGPLLRKTVTFEQAVVAVPDSPNLFVLPAGPVKLPDDTERMVSGFKDLVNSWRREFDHIIIDTVPLLPVADTVRTSVEADSVVMVIRSGQIERDAFLQAQELLFRVNARLTGLVFNGADVNSSYYQHYRSYYAAEGTNRLEAAS